MSDLVLGIARNYEWRELQPFVSSLRKTGFDGRVCLFVSNCNRDTLAKLRAHDCEIQDFSEAYLPILPGKRLYAYDRRLSLLHRFYPLACRMLSLPSGSKRSQRREELARHIVGCWCARFILYRHYLASNGADVKRVLLSDTRDVVFQKNPFEAAPYDRLHCFLEDSSMTIGNCPFNSQWIADAFGELVLSELADCPISCSGVTVGGLAAMEQYLERMVHHIMKLSSLRPGLDQGVHNYVIHQHEVQADLLTNADGFVLTMGYTGDVIFNDRGQVVDERGDVVSVLHQYDRHPDAASKILSPYVS